MHISKILVATIVLASFLAGSFPAQAKTTNPVYEFDGWWWLDDDASGLDVEDNTGFGAGNAAQETHITDLVKNSIVRLRVDVSETANQSVGDTFGAQLQFQQGDVSCTAGGTWTTITTSAANAFALADSSTITDQNTTDIERIIGSSKAFLAGSGTLQDTTNPAPGIVIANKSIEWEFSVIATTNALNSQIYTFRVIDSTGTAVGYTGLPVSDDCPNATTAAAATTTLSTGTNPGNSTIAPGGAITSVNGFTLTTNSGTDAITNITVNLSTNSGVGTLTITNGVDAVLGSIGGGTGAGIITGSNSISISSTNATTGGTAFKVKVTPLSHAAMPVPNGGAYAITGVVTDWAGTNTKAGQASDTSDTVTIDNLSPNGATSVSGTAGNAANTVNWTSSNSADFNTTSGSVIYRWTAASAGSEVPTEGSTVTIGAVNGTATAACVVSSAASAVLSKIDGSGGSAECTTTALTNGQAYTYKAFQKDTNGNYDVGVLIGTFTPTAPPVVVTASSTGTQTTNFNSGATVQELGARFRFQQDTGTAVNITAFTLTDTGSIIFDSSLSEEVSNVSLSYKTGDVGTCATGGETTVGNGTLGAGTETVAWSAITIPATVGANFTCVYIRSNAAGVGPIYPNGGDTIDLRIAASTDFTLSSGTKAGTFPVDPTGATTILPVIDSYTNSSESGLNWTGSCTGCGARIGPRSATQHQAVTINGKGFGADPGAGLRDTATNKVEIVGASTNVIDDDGTGNTNVQSWNNTTIVINTSSEQTGDTDTDWGTNFGDSAALRVTAGSQAVPTDREFFVFPQITSISNTPVVNGDREGDTIDLNGTRFGSSQGSGSVTILGVSAGAASVWNNTLITVTVPTAIADNSYTGNIVITQGTGTNGKTHTFSTFRILPRIISTGPVDAKGGQSQTVTINGNHFCQDTTCADYATDSDDATFNAVSAKSSYTAVSDTSISLSVPATATDGNLIVKSDSANGGTVYDSNAYSYNVKFGPSQPTGSSAGGSNNPTLNGTAFSDGTDGDTTHVKTHWQLAHSTDGDWSTPEWSRTTTTGLTSTVVDTTDGGTFANSDVGQTALDCGTTYKGRVRYMDNGNSGADTQTWEWSAYSTDYTFSTASCNNLTVGVNGSQLASITRGTNNNSLGGTANPSGAFTFVTSASAGTITSIKVSETVAGFVANNNLNNLKLYGDTGGSVTGQYEAGLDTQIGTTQTTFAADETVTFSGLSLAANTTAIYVYVIADIDADPTSGQTIEIQITNPSTDVAVTSASNTDTVAKAIVGTTTVANPNVTVAATGSQTANLTRGSTNQYVGGAFTLTMASATGTLTSFAVMEQGTVDANANLNNVKLYGDTGGSITGTYEPGSDTQIGTTQSFATNKATFGSLSLGLTTSATYIYIVFDVNSAATAGQDIQIEVNASGDVVGTGFNVSGAFPVQISGLTNIQDPSLTVGTNGSQTANLNSGDTVQTSGGSFTFVLTGATGTLNSFVVSETSASLAAQTDLTSVKLQTDTDGTYPGADVTGCTSLSFNASDQVTCTPTGGLSLSTTVRYVYIVFDLASTATGGETIEAQITNPSTDVSVTGASNTDTVAKAIAGTTTIRPVITGYTNSSESGLNWAASCTGCGARIGLAASSQSQTVVISGAGFGADPGAGSRDTATNKVEIVGASTTLLTDNIGSTNVTAWSPTSITITTDTGVTSNADTNWGTNFGDSAALRVTAGSQAVPTDREFFVFPQITSISNTPVVNGDREGDTIDLNGTRFGSSQGSGSVTILGVSAGAASVWNNTLITVTVPTAIADNSYTGNIVITQGTGTNGKTHTFSTFRILPRITSLSPSIGISGDPIVIIGNHLCQTGTCPLAGSRSTASDNVTFYNGIQVTDVNVTAWGHGDSSTSGVNVNVPSAAVTGNVVVKSNTTYDSNGVTFTKQSTVPNDPSSLQQYESDGTTVIAIGNKTKNGVTTNLTFKASMTGYNPSTLCLQIENALVGTPFNGTVTGEETGGACESYTGTPVIGSVTITSLTATNGYHWRARVKNSSTTETSGWVSFGGNTENPPTNPADNDYYIDTTAPAISSIASSAITASGATITWTTADETSDSKVKYGASCPPTPETAVSQTSGVTSHSVALSGLSSNTTYQYQVVSVDRNTDGSEIGNSSTGPSAGTCNTFQTSKANTKTLEYFIRGETGTLSYAAGGNPQTFQATITETGYVLQDVFVEINGIAGTGSGNMTLSVKAYGSTEPGSYTNYMIPLNGSVVTPFTVLHKVDPSAVGLYISPASSSLNTLKITPGSGDPTVSVASAKIIVTYYAPPQ